MIKLGFAGFRHSHIYTIQKWAHELPHLEIAGAWEEDTAARAQAAEHGITVDCESYEALLAKCDIVAVGDYYARHGTLVLQALQAGRHVLTDKPLCTSLAELHAIRELTEKTGLCAVPMLDLRYRAASGIARDVLSSGAMGRVNSISFGGQHALSFGKRPGWYFEAGKHGGTINDIAVHGLDLVRDITGSGIAKINAARCWNAFAVKAPDFRDSAQFMATLENGAGLLGDTSYAMPNGLLFTPSQTWQFTFWCDGGILAFNCAQDCVQITAPGASAPHVLTGTVPPGNPLTALLAEMRGAPERLCTKAGILATEDALKLQKAADDNE